MSDVQPPVSGTIWARFLKRPCDVLAAIVLLVLLGPLLLIAMLMVKLTSRGPIFYAQDRVGLRGSTIRPLKLRTMAASHRHDPNEPVPLEHAEITPVGRWFRRFKVDELPQLINVLRGDMSLIGPRPTIPEQVARYDDFRRQRLLIRPGITGLAQVHGNTGISWDQRILYDVAYVRRCSFLLDVRIIFLTVRSIVLEEARTILRFEDSRYSPWVAKPPGYETRD